MSYSDEEFERYVRGEISESQLLRKKVDGVFEVGDRVIAKHPDHIGQFRPDIREKRKLKGTVVYIHPKKLYIGVEWDSYVKGHGGQDAYYGQYGYCWNVNENEIRHV